MPLYFLSLFGKYDTCMEEVDDGGRLLLLVFTEPSNRSWLRSVSSSQIMRGFILVFPCLRRLSGWNLLMDLLRSIAIMADQKPSYP